MSAPPWFPNQQQPGFQYPQQTGFQQSIPTGYPGAGPGFLQPQRTGFPGQVGFNQQQQQSGGAPPVPPIPQNFQSQFQQQQQPQLQLPGQQFGQNGSVSGVAAQQRFLSPSPGLGGQLTAQHTAFNGSVIGGIRPLISQPTGSSDPRMQMMSSTFMPANIQAPYAPSGAPQFSGGPPSSQSLQQSFQQHNQAQRGTTAPKVPWVLSKEERKNYDQIFRAWDLSNSGFIDGDTATEVFSQSGLDRNELAQIWALADAENRGKLNIQEFHVAMGLIYRRLNGNEIPLVLPPEMEPVSSKHLSESVDFLKDLLKNDTNVRATAIESRGKVYSFGDSPTPKTNPRKDGTIYKHDDTNVRGYTSSSRRVDRSAIRSGETTPSDDLSDIKQQLQNTNKRFDKIRADAESRTAEDEALNNELDDLKYRVRRVQEDLDHVSRGPRPAAKDQERRKLERELLYLMHEKVPEVEKQIEERDRRKQREKEEWVRDRDRRNDRNRSEHDSSSRRRSRERSDFSSDDEGDKGYLRGTYDRKDNYHGSYRQNGSRDRDRDQDYRRDGRDRSRERDWGRGYDRDRDYDRRASPALVHSPASPSPTTSSTVNEVRKSAAAPAPTVSPAPPTKNMTAEERAEYNRQQARQRIQDRMKALGLGGPAPPSSPPVDTSVEDRLERERKEAEEKALQAERDAEERERARKERLDALRPPPPEKKAPSVPAVQKRPPPIPPPRPKAAPSAIPKPASPASAPQPVPRAPKVVVPVEDEEEKEEKRRREEIAKRRAARQAELQRLEEEARREEAEHQKRIEALKASQRERMTPSSSPSPASTPGRTPSVPVAPPRPVAVPLAPPPPVPSSVPSPNTQKTNPFHRLTQQGPGGLPSSTVSQSSPWATPEVETRLPIVPSPVPPTPPLPASSLVPAEVAVPPPPPPPPAAAAAAAASPAPAHQERTLPPASKNPYPAVGNSYKPSAADDWGDSDSDSSDEETLGRVDRAEIANAIFGGIVRPKSAAAGSATSDTPPQSSQAPKVPDIAFKKSEEPADRGVLMNAITSGVPKLRKTVTNDRSGVAIAGSVIGGDANPLTHITNPLRVPSSEVPSIVHGDSEHNEFETLTHKKSETTTEQPINEEHEEEMRASVSNLDIDQSAETGPGKVTDDLMADIEIDTTLSVRSLYPYDGQRAEDLSFSENVVISAHPSKSGDDWWHGTLVSNGKRGFFPASYVVVIEQVTHARALFTYHSSSAEELSFNEDDTLSIVERSEGDWWKAQKDGSVFLVPAAYLEVVNVLSPSLGVLVDNTESVTTPTSPTLNRQASDNIKTPGRSRGDNDDYSEHSQYHSFSESDDEQQSSSVKPEDTEVEFQLKAAERAHILEAAGLILKMDKTEPPPPRPTRRRSAKNRRTPPLPPQKEPSPSSARYKELPPIPSEINNSVLHDDDAFDRYEQYRQQQSSIQGMSSPPSVTSIDNVPPSPASASYSFVSIQSKDDSSHRSGGSSFLLFLQKAGSRATTALSTDRKSTLTISAPVISAPMADAGTSIQRSNTPAFGSSWSSLVDESALEGIPSMERRRQEAMFELITTESGYVHDLQLIIETFYAPLLKILTEKESVGVFANIEELLLCNTAFLSSLEGRQKESRLYIDSISDILEEHAPGFDIYAGYCVGQGPAIKLLQTLRETKPDLDAYLQETRNDPATRNLDLSSYLLIPMQRITRYPLLLKQISANTQGDEDRKRIDSSIHTIERILDSINERIREREGQERLASVSKNLWIGQGRLDLTAATRYMGRRTLVKEGVLIKAKSGRRLRAFLCNDVLVLTDESANSIYRMPIPLTDMQVSEPSGTRDEAAFQISVAYPRGGDIIKLKATSIKECQDWIRAIGNASAECRRADRRASHTSF